MQVFDVENYEKAKAANLSAEDEQRQLMENLKQKQN
jgi:hypothetical protein